MGKNIVKVLVMCMAMSYASISAIAAYPLSVEFGTAAPSDGAILTGELIGTPGWGGSEETDYRFAFDGDYETFFDPETGADPDCYTGVKLDKSYVLTEIRIHPRTGYIGRFLGATIQGSNDGETWTDLWASEEAAEYEEFQIIPASALSNNTGYSYYRYVNTIEHGDVAEVEFWGNPAEATAEEAPAEETPTEAPTEEAPAEETPAEETPTEAPAEEAPVQEVTPVAPTTTTAPATDNMGFAAVLAAFAAAAVGATKIVRRKNNK